MMLFERKVGEEIVLSMGGIEVAVKVNRIGSHCVKLSVDAPPTVIVRRRSLAIDNHDEQRATK